MKYGYTLKGKGIAVGLMLMFAVLALLVTDTIYKIGAGLAALLLLKDVVSTFTCEFVVTDKGLVKRDIFGETHMCNWHDLEYITITKKNKEWVALVSSDSMSYLKKHIANKRELLLDMISYAKKNKQLAIHDFINEKYNLKLSLNDEGKIRSK